MRGLRHARDDWKTFDRRENEGVRPERSGKRSAGVQQSFDIAASQKRRRGESLHMFVFSLRRRHEPQHQKFIPAKTAASREAPQDFSSCLFGQGLGKQAEFLVQNLGRRGVRETL
jgi:hypothetical protein